MFGLEGDVWDEREDWGMPWLVGFDLA